MKPFKFFRTPFNPRQYDVEGFTFIGVSPIKTNEDVQALLDEITVLRQDLLAANQQILTLQTSASINTTTTTR